MVKHPAPSKKILGTLESPMMKYIMIGILVILLAFALAYVFNIQKMVADSESFSNSDTPSFQVVYIYSDSCGYCTKFTPTFNQFAAVQQSNTKLRVLSYERSDPEAAQYMKNVNAFPTVLVLDNVGNLVTSQTGNMSFAALQAFVTSAT